MAPAAPALERERRALLGALLVAAAGGWLVVLRHAGGGSGHDDMAMGGVDLTMGMGAPLYLAMWMAMMVAMMFPAAAPMVLAFSRSQSRRGEQGHPHVPTWVFLAPYLVVWLAFGGLGYLAALGFNRLVGDSAWAMDNVPRIAGALLVAAGLYQLTPLKRRCLTRCRTPLSFMLSYWRDGRRGAVEMGLRHGLFCLGCCWVLFLVLLPLGVMNVAAMVAVAALVLAEKVLPAGERVAVVAAVVLVGYGLVALAVPAALPTAV
jgi:predicted metal-binding membrane protein